MQKYGAQGTGKQSLGSRSSALAILALVILTALFLASGASAAYAGDLFGVNSEVSYKNYNTTYSGNVDKELDALAAAGVKWVRLDLSWGWAESKKGIYDSTYLNGVDAAVAKAKARGINVLFATVGSPLWANPGGKGYPPQNPQDFANWLTVMVNRYKGSVHHWEIWNEPNNKRFWGGAPNAAQYVALLKVSYAAVKAADPSAVVVSAGLGQGGGALEPGQFLKDMYAAGLKGNYDKLGFHPYSAQKSPDTWYDSSPRDTFPVTAKVIYPIMQANGDGAKGIWLTEMGYSTYQKTDGTVGTYGVDEATQAKYLKRAYDKVRTEWPFVEVMFWYNTRNDGTTPTAFEQNIGIMRRDYTPKPSYQAYKDAVAAAGGTTVTTLPPTTSTTVVAPTTTTTASTTTTTVAPTTTTLAPTTTTLAPTTSTTLASTTSTTVRTTTSTLPGVQFVKPAEGAIVQGLVSVEVSVSSSVGILRVEFSVDGALVGSDRSAPYRFSWNATKVAQGDHALMATAYDQVGNVAGAARTVKKVTSTVSGGQTAIAGATYIFAGGTSNAFSTGVLYPD